MTAPRVDPLRRPVAAGHRVPPGAVGTPLDEDPEGAEDPESPDPEDPELPEDPKLVEGGDTLSCDPEEFELACVLSPA